MERAPAHQFGQALPFGIILTNNRTTFQPSVFLILAVIQQMGRFCRVIAFLLSVKRLIGVIYLSKQDLRIMRTLKEIDRALLECLGQSPIEKITVDQICQRAMINRSTFYTYYRDKFDLLYRYLDRLLYDFRKRVDVAFINATPKEVGDLIYQQNFEQVLQYMQENREVFQLLWSLPLKRSIFEEMTQVVYDRILERMSVIQDDVYAHYVDLYARLFASDMMTMVRWWFTCSDRVSSEKLQEIMSSNMKNGLFQTFFNYIRQA